MLRYNNPKDKEKMMRYHRTKDMINLLNFFPEISPIRNLTIVESIEDYKKHYEFLKDLPGERNDSLITKPFMKSIEGTGIKPDIPSILKKVKEIDKEGVIALFDLCHKPSERYERYAGISLGVSLGKGVYIDAVGKGFDGREVSKGLSCHERYFIPWFSLREVNGSNFRKYRTYLVSQEEYEKSRKNRIKFLESIQLNEEIFSTYNPEIYQEIPDFIWLDVIKNVIKKLEDREEELKSAGLEEFAISGHTEGKKWYPWQMFDKSRYKVKE